MTTYKSREDVPEGVEVKEVESTCWGCNGSGEGIGSDHCSQCGGDGEVTELVEVDPVDEGADPIADIGRRLA